MPKKPDPLAVLASLVLEDGRTWGVAAADFQWVDAEAYFHELGARRHYLTRPRGGSKSTDVAGFHVADLVTGAPAGSRSYVVASDADQAGLLVDAMAGLVRRTPGLPTQLDVRARSVVHRNSGASVEVLPADGPSAFGLRPWALTVDEFAQWANTNNARRVWEAVFSSVEKVPGCRLVVISTAGDPAHYSHRVLTAALESPAWRVHEVPGPLPWVSPEAMAEQQRMLLPSQYARLHLNRWCAPDDRLTTIDALARCVVLDGPQDPQKGVRYVISLDVGLKRDRTVAAICHASPRAESNGAAVTVTLDRMAVWQGNRADPVQLNAVEAWIAQASRDYNHARVVADPYQAAQLLERLQDRGIKAEEFPFTSASVGKLALRLFNGIRDGALELPDDRDLLDELANVRLKETSPGVYRLDHDPDKHDDRATALALAVNWLSEHTRRAVPDVGPISVTKECSWVVGGSFRRLGA